MTLAETRRKIAADLKAILKAIRANTAMSARDLMAATGLTEKRLSNRLKDAQASGKLIFVRLGYTTVWCEPGRADEAVSITNGTAAKGRAIKRAAIEHRESIIRQLVTAAPEGESTSAIADALGVRRTTTKTILQRMKSRGELMNWPTTGSAYSVWFLTENRVHAEAAYAAKLIDANKFRREKKQREVAAKLSDETPESGDFFKQRIVPAHAAPRMAIKGPASVWGLASCL